MPEIFSNDGQPETVTRNRPLEAAEIRRTKLRLPFALRSPLPEFHAVQTVASHWESLRAERLAPGRDEIDPRALAECLDTMFVAELVAPKVARLRLCGQHLYDLVGLEPRGMPLSVFFEGCARDELAGALEQVQQGARVILSVRSERALGRPVLDGQVLLLPLTDHTGKITRVLGVLETLGPIGRAPRKFKLSAPLSAKMAIAQQSVDPAVKPESGATAVQVISNSDQRGVSPARGSAPHLRVIDGGKS